MSNASANAYLSERRTKHELNPNAIAFHPGLQCHPIRPPRRRRPKTKFNPQVQKILSAVDLSRAKKTPQSTLQGYLEQVGVMKNEAPKTATKKNGKPEIVQQLFNKVQRTRLISSGLISNVY